MRLPGRDADDAHHTGPRAGLAVTAILLFAGSAIFLLGVGFALTLAKAGARADEALEEARRRDGGRMFEWEDVGS